MQRWELIKYIIIPNTVLQERFLTDGAKLLYGLIYSVSYKTGECYATNKWLAENLNVSERTITRKIKELEQIYKIVIERRKNNQRIIRCLDKIHWIGSTDSSFHIDKDVYK